MYRRKSFRRVALIILDGVGVGALPDAAAYGDATSDSIGNIIRLGRNLILPHLAARGLAKITTLPGYERAGVAGAFGKSAMASPGKDSIEGHWELAGVIHAEPLPLFPQGFPAECVAALERATGKKFIGNKPASGTAIIEELGAEHLSTGDLILYTSADSVCQIAAHVDVVSIPELHEIGMKARGVMRGGFAVARVIVRPFEGVPGHFRRISIGRRDFALPPPAPTLLDRLTAAGYDVWGVGKVKDLFAGKGFTDCTPAADNDEGIKLIRERLRSDFHGLLMANLNDFDTAFGHRNDVEGYCAALERFDAALPDIENDLGKDDLLIITSDHGNDPTTPSTDHSREYTPLLCWHRGITEPVPLGTRATLADVGQTVAVNFGIDPLPAGNSFLEEIAF